MQVKVEARQVHFAKSSALKNFQNIIFMLLEILIMYLNIHKLWRILLNKLELLVGVDQLLLKHLQFALGRPVMEDDVLLIQHGHVEEYVKEWHF